jgi:small ligand-binding sensory domain FIST
LQVVQGTYDTATTSTSNTYVDTGLTATITPTSATSKVLVLVSQPTWITVLSGTPTDLSAQFRTMRGGTNIIENSLALNVGGAANGNWQNASVFNVNFLDSPATTSATTYKTQQKSDALNTVQTQRISSDSTMILMEIGA